MLVEESLVDAVGVEGAGGGVCRVDRCGIWACWYRLGYVCSILSWFRG